MSKYKVGDELLIINDPNAENEKLKSLTKISFLYSSASSPTITSFLSLLKPNTNKGTLYAILSPFLWPIV